MVKYTPPLRYVDRLNQISDYLGTSIEDTVCRVGTPRTQKYTRSLPIKPLVPFSTPIPRENPPATDLLLKMFDFGPAKGVTCEEALNYRYPQIQHDLADKPVRPTKFNFGFEGESMRVRLSV